MSTYENRKLRLILGYCKELETVAGGTDHYDNIVHSIESEWANMQAFFESSPKNIRPELWQLTEKAVCEVIGAKATGMGTA